MNHDDALQPEEVAPEPEEIDPVGPVTVPSGSRLGLRALVLAGALLLAGLDPPTLDPGTFGTISVG